MHPKGGNCTKEKTVPEERPMPAPEPGRGPAGFLAWLKKRGSEQDLSFCVKVWARRGVQIEEEVRRWGIPNIRICRTGRGDKVVLLVNKVWADRWLIHYGTELPHHAQFKRTERKCSETENKANVY